MTSSSKESTSSSSSTSTSSYQWMTQWFSSSSAAAETQESCPHRQKQAGECPVQHKASEEASQCPVNHETRKQFEKIALANESQSKETSRLCKSRAPSTIPKGDFTPSHQVEGSETWLYPSEEQYYKAMKKKGWNPQQRDMKSILAIHNTVNEKGWNEILKWEALHANDPNYKPKLLRFTGRPRDLSPKARFLSLLGYTTPFDRHDWIVDRDGEHVRYVLDYYTGNIKDGDKPLSMHIDVRPALDSFGSAWDRIRMQYYENISPFMPFGGAFELQQASFIKSMQQEPTPQRPKTSANVESDPPAASS